MKNRKTQSGSGLVGVATLPTEYVIRYMEKDTRYPALAGYAFKEMRVGKDISRGEARMKLRAWLCATKKQRANIVAVELVEVKTLERC